jgi:hypothetical protein
MPFFEGHEGIEKTEGFAFSFLMGEYENGRMKKA